jgi:Domain of unknown function (DUF5602)
MQSKFLIVLALTGLTGADATGPLDPPADTRVVQRTYGVAVALGKGQARTYVARDRTGAALEVGVAMDEAALEGLPATGSVAVSGHEHHDSYILSLPAGSGMPYRFVELNWNPNGHGGPYTAPHFDFHFYRVPQAERDAIDPAVAGYAERAANFPRPEQFPAGYVSSHTLMNLSPAQAAVPKMGLHWLDLASPELPPKNQPFTATFIVGSWDGKVIFDEPMITRDFILAQRDKPAATEIPVPASVRSSPEGFYLKGYQLSYDAQWKEYRIALTGLSIRN